MSITSEFHLSRKIGKVILLLLLCLMIVHAVFTIRSYAHSSKGYKYLNAGKYELAGREFQSAIGYHLPLSPFSKSSVYVLADMSHTLPLPDQRRRAGEQLRVSIQGLRSFYQPFQGVLDNLSEETIQYQSDPNPFLFLLSMLSLLLGWSVWWISRYSLAVRGVTLFAALTAWGTLLHLC